MSPERRWSATDLADALERPRPTPEQAAVIEAPLRPTLVVAGAGAGKTETMASRVVWLVANRHVEPDEVLGLTFTRKAAAELSERLATRLSALRAAGVWTPRVEEGAEVLGGTPTVSTYHSYAGRLVSEHGLRLGHEPDARLLTEAGAWQVAHEAVLTYDGPMDEVVKAASTITAAVVDLAGEMAEHLVTLGEVDARLGEVLTALDAVTRGEPSRLRAFPREVRLAMSQLRERRAVLPVVARYGELKRRRGAVDFADQMALAARLAGSFPDIGALERGRFRAVLLDEFQDTSQAQLVLLRSLFAAEGERAAVTAVGDPHQSIYGWRGASATTLDAFRDGFTDPSGRADVLHLSTSWRNDEAVLDLANRLAAPLAALTRVPVRSLTARPDAGPGRVRTARLETVETEAAFVADWVARERSRPDVTTSAVLCRKRSQFDAVVAALGERSIPYEVVGLGGLLVTPEVADLVALLWVVQDPGRGDHLMRLLTGPLCRLGLADLDGLAAWARHRQASPRDERRRADLAPDSAERASLVEALDDLPQAAWHDEQGASLGARALERLQALAVVVRRLRALAALALPELVGEAERAIGLDIEVLSRPAYTPAAARAHLDAFADVAAQFSASADRPTLGGFLEWLDAAMAEERGLELGWIETSADAVQVMTVHAAKGLEWDAVAVPGLVEASFPAHSATTSKVVDGAWGHAPPSDKGWLGGLGGIPHDLRGDADALPRFGWRSVATWDTLDDAWRGYLEDSAAHGIAEERRLAYVAMTRARCALLLTAHVWATAKTPRVTSRFLLEARVDTEAAGASGDPGPWCPMPAVDTEAVNPRTAEVVAVAWPPERPGGTQAGRLRAAADAVGAATATRAARAGPWDEVVEVLLAERAQAGESARGAVRLPRHLSTSALVALARDPAGYTASLRRPMPEPPALAARRGTAFHTWVERHYRQAAIVEVDELPGSADEGAAADESLPAMRQRFLASEWADRVPVEVETSLETVVQGLPIRGRADAVFADGDGWVVIDWKTGPRPPADELDTRVLQLAVYRLAWARLRGVCVDRVRAAFYYAATGETVHPRLPGEEAIAAVLDGIPSG